MTAKVHRGRPPPLALREERPAGLDEARAAKLRKRTGVPLPHGLQPLAHTLVPQKLRGVYGPRTVARQKLTPEFPPRTPAPPVHGVLPLVRAPGIPRHTLARPVHGVEFSPRDRARPVHTPEFLRLAVERGRHGPGDEPEILADQENESARPPETRNEPSFLRAFAILSRYRAV